MGTIFVAYGRSENRATVLEVAAEQAAVCDRDLFVYHVQESPDESVQQISDEIETVIQQTAPDITFEVDIETRDGFSERTNISEEKHVLDAIHDRDSDYEFVVMGHRKQGFLDELSHPSMTETVLESHTIPVLLVPLE